MDGVFHRFLTVIVGVPLFVVTVAMLSQRPATCLLILLVCVPLAIRQRRDAIGRRAGGLARQLMPTPRQVSATDRAAAAAVWRVLGAVFVVAGAAAGAAWYVTRGPIELWMAAAYFAWGVIAFLILDRAIERRFRQGWLRRALRALLAACFAWTLVAPWRLLCRLSDWYFERHPLSGAAIALHAFEDDNDLGYDPFDDDRRYSVMYRHLPQNLHYEDEGMPPIHDPC